MILKPSPAKVQDLYIESLEALGIDLTKHDLRFEEDNWESPTLGAWGVGWQVVLDGMEISQFTYFQQVGGLDCRPVSAELTYGIERICMFLGGYDNIFDLVHGEVKTDDGVFPVTYGQMRQREEFELSAYSFEHADIDLHRTLFDAFEKEGWRLLKDHGHFLSAYEQALKMSHTFNVLDARGAVSTTERPGIIKRVRDLACACARAYLEHQEGAVDLPKPPGRWCEVSATQTFLLELHCEEIPARFLSLCPRIYGSTSGYCSDRKDLPPDTEKTYYVHPAANKLWRLTGKL